MLLYNISRCTNSNCGLLYEIGTVDVAFNHKWLAFDVSDVPLEGESIKTNTK